ncbi:HAD-IA family hydrolase [Streptococcaceae bacterium ESL0687]|nr:HAD-IA family hydrolase [Streptococcaceae bacterium ESL0687]
MKYDDYIWDLGGTLLDNYETSAQAFEKTLKKFGISVRHQEVYDALRNSTDYAVDKFASAIPDFLASYKEEERLSLEKPVLFDGAYQVLEAITNKGGRNFMISHRNNHVLDILKAAGIDKFFTEVVTSDNGFPRKPSPQSILYLVDKYQMDKPVMIGDRHLDIEAGNNASIPTIFFSLDGEDKEASYNVKNLEEILSL